MLPASARMALGSPAAHAWRHRLTLARPRGRRAALLVAVLVGLILVGWGAGELIRSLHAADLRAVRDVATHRGPVDTAIARVLSRVGSSLVIGPLVLVGCAVAYRVAGAAPAAFIAVSTAGAVAIFNLDKLLVARPRPPVDHLEAASHSSFPSGHATLSAAFYVALVIVFASRSRARARTAAVLSAAVLLVAGIAASRVYLGVHYPTDVGAGLLLGAAWTVVAARSFRISAAGPRARPAQAARESTP